MLENLYRQSLRGSTKEIRLPQQASLRYAYVGVNHRKSLRDLTGNCIRRGTPRPYNCLIFNYDFNFGKIEVTHYN